MKILYYDCFSGISGDMHLGALLDLGVDRQYLLEGLGKLDLDGYEIKINRDERRGVSGTRVDVVLQPHDDHHGSHDTHGRTYRDIVELIRASSLPKGVKTVGLDIFARLAQAEAKVHNHKIEDVHFHEVGAVDSIVDIVGAALCLAYLKPDRILCSPVQVGGGFVKCAHGTFPVPAPATAELLKGIPVKSGLVPCETTTPTGAAILAACVHEFTECIQFTPSGIGYGIGQRDTEVPNVLRVYLGDLEAKATIDDAEVHDALLVECNIDDMNPELYDEVMAELFARGALDVFFMPIIMKKSRPAVTISVICSEEKRRAIEETLLLQTTTFGIRTQKITKTMLRRDFKKVATKYGDITVKSAYYRGQKIKSKPEYEDCKRLAEEKGVSLREIYASIPSEET
jgi:pyridinium-3,5-bisthiocarboxylic acid mononucleotide nickel chelatase